MISINTNLGSLFVQNNLKTATKGLNQAIERMTTGFKINGAKDNAANFAISTQLDTKISAYNVAEENVSMGLDLVTTASDSLSQIEDKLARIRALQEQAINGTYGEDSLKAINSEVNALVDEINRLYGTTSYNGIQLFRESVSGIEKTIYKQYDSSWELTSYSKDFDEYGAEVYFIGDGGYSIVYSQGSSPDPDLFRGIGVVNGNTVHWGDLVIPADYIYSEDDGCFYDSAGNALVMYVDTYDDNLTKSERFTTYGKETKVTVPVDNVKNNISFQVSINGDEASKINLDTSFVLKNLEALRGVGLDATTDYLSQLDELLATVSAKQTEYGAVQNRLESALEQIGVCYENLVSTRSTIKDADVAKESSEYIRNQILQQASATLLATANQTPSIALQLL